MKEKIENPRLDNLQIAHIQQTNPLAGPLGSHNVAGSPQLDFGLEKLFETGLAGNKNRLLLDSANVVGFSIAGLPSVGKTTLIEKTLDSLFGRARVAVLEVETSLEIDTSRLQLLGIPVLPITPATATTTPITSTSITPARSENMHSERIEDALRKLDLNHFDALFIEETTFSYATPSASDDVHKKVAVLTIANGEDVPRKHPWILSDADCVVIAKTDLLPHLKADLGQLLDNIEDACPGLPIFDLSAETGDGMEAWEQWLIQQIGGEIAEHDDLMYADKPVYVPIIG